MLFSFTFKKCFGDLFIITLGLSKKKKKTNGKMHLKKVTQILFFIRLCTPFKFYSVLTFNIFIPVRKVCAVQSIINFDIILILKPKYVITVLTVSLKYWNLCFP